LTVFLLASVSVFADHHEGPCAADMKKLCGDVKAGGGAKMRCMKEHEKDLSAECKAKLAEKKEQRHEMKEARHQQREACAADMKKFCSDVKPGGGAKMRCMKEHEKELSAECKAQHAKLQDLRKEHR
jgi:hypothetical protein